MDDATDRRASFARHCQESERILALLRARIEDHHETLASSEKALAESMALLKRLPD
jgi:hypothetical protein